MRRILAVSFALLFVVGLGLVPAASAQTREETLIYSLQSDIDNWDPPNSVLREAIILGYHVFDHLAVRDLKTRKVGPNLATSWKAIDDTTWEVKLRQGVKFHDGTPFTAKDVKATFDRVLDPTKKMTARGNHAKIKTVEIVDDYTVRFKTDGPYPLFVERLTAQVMQSEKVIREKGHDFMQENPIGTGPYKLVKWNRKQEHIIKAIPPDQMDVINKSGSARTATSPILRTAMLQLDQAARSGPNPFTDKRVRQAANLAVDSDAIIKHVLNGLGDRTATGINPMAFGWDANLKPYKQDLAAAKKLLAEAGFPNGVDIVFHEGPPIVEPAIQQTNDAIVADMTKAGFRVKRNFIGDNTVLVARIKDGKAGSMFNWSWGYYSVFDADAILYDVFKCGENYSYYCNPALDDLISQGRSTLDAKKRAETYVKAQKLLFDDAAYLYKWGLRGVWGISNRVDYEAPADEVDRMFIVTPRKK
jgi:peptide/nickel transport system substrate-binding protein